MNTGTPPAADEPAIPFLARRGLAAALAGFVVTEVLTSFTSMPVSARHAAAVTVATAICWVLDAMPLGAASLIPLALFPILGVLPATTVATTYFDDVNFLFLGGMVLGAGVERWNLHRRIALGVVRLIGTSPRRLVLGFLVGTAFVSMWISNTATAVMMYPIALAVVEAAGLDVKDAGHRSFAAALLIVVAYGANIGGLATPIGTGPNIVMLSQFSSGRPLGELPPPTFLGWMVGMVPIAAAACLVAWVLVTRIAIRVPARMERLEETFVAQVQPRPWTRPEVRIGLLFLVAVVLWVTRTLRFEGIEYGWLRFFPEDLGRGIKLEDAITNTTVAVLFCVFAFALPAGDAEGSRLVDARAIRNVPWEMLLLLGAGSAIAASFRETRLSEWFGQALAPAASQWSALAIVAGTSLFVTFLSEVTSNTATAQVMIPLSVEIGRAAGIDPRLPALSVTLAASLAFMLPIGTPPNAIVFSSGRIPMTIMVRSGLVLNLCCVVLSTAAVFLWTGRSLGFGGAP